MQIKLIILDFDGTLATTEQANMQAYILALREEGFSLSEEEFNSRFFGMRCPEFLEALGVEDADQRERIRRRKIEIYPSLFDSVKLNEPLWEFAQAFRCKGVKVWIVSTGQLENLTNAMRHLGIEGMVDGLLYSDDVKEPKPSPEAFLKVMEREGVTPEETLIFEDSMVGIAAAEASGAAYIKV